MFARIRAVALATVLAACTLPSAVLAQSVVPGELGNAARLGEQLQRQQQELQDERQRERDRAQQKPSGADLPAAQAAPKAGGLAEGQCIDAKSLEVVGARLLPQKKLAQLQQAVAGHCVGAHELNALLRQITDLYVSLGYVTTRAYIPPQDSHNGKITIVVIEGKVERIEVKPPGSATAATAFPGMTGTVFNLRDAEQGIDQLNRLASNNARLDILPGTTPGSSVLEILNTPRRRIGGSLSVDDTGSPATGLWLSTATFIADDPLHLNDGLLASFSRNVDGPSPALSRAITAAYSIPYGWWTGELNYNETGYTSLVKGKTRNFDTSGISRNETVRLDRVAYRDQHAKLTLYADITHREVENFVAGQLIGTSSRSLTLLDLSANLSLAEGDTLWSITGGLSRGVRWLGGFHDANDLPIGAPHGDFLKGSASAGVTRSFMPFGIRTQISSTLTGQWSNDVLYPTEQLAISGPYSVRGYRDENLYGDRGFTWRNELGFPFALASGNASPLIIKPYLGADYGEVRAHETVPGAYLSSRTVGANFSFTPFVLDLSWSDALWRSRTVPDDHYFFARFAASF